MAQFRHLVDRLLAAHPSEQLRSLMASVAMLNFATASIALFEPIYLITLGWSLRSILLLNAALYALMLILLPFGARVSRAVGFQHAMLFSSPFLIASYVSLYAMRIHPLFGASWLLSSVLFIVLYWPSFHGEIAGFGNDGERGREISGVHASITLAAIVGPIFGGVMIAVAGFPALFAVASMLIVASNLPFLSMPEPRRKAEFGYRESFKRLVAPENRRQTVSILGFGEDLFSLVVWPIFIYQMLGGFTATGAIVSASLLVTTLLALAIGRISDAQSRHAVLRTGTIFLAAAWVVRIFARGPLSLLGADAFYRFAGGTTWIPLASLVYARAKRGGRILETVILFEQSLAVGKILAALAGAAILTFFPENFSALFGLAAGMSLLYALYP